MNIFFVLIFVIFILLFKNHEIKLNIIIGIIFACICVLYKNEHNIKIKNDTISLKHKKIKLIEPGINKLDKYDDIVDFLFSIQDFYIYNPQAYENMHSCITNFFIVYEDIIKNEKLTNTLYSIADKNMYDAINHLHSFIYSLPENDTNVRNKLHVAIDILEKILNKYLNELYNIHINNNLKGGYHVDYKIINTGPKEFNFYGDESTNFNFII